MLPCVATVCSFLWLNSIPPCEHSTTGLFSLWLSGFWLVSTFWPLGIVLLWTFSYRFSIRFLWTYVGIPAGHNLKGENARSHGMLSVQLHLKLSNGFPKQFYHQHSHQQWLRGAVASDPHQRLVLWSFSSWQCCWVCRDLYCGSDLHIPNEPWCRASFHMLIDHLVTHLREVSVQLFGPFFIGICLFLIKSHSSFSLSSRCLWWL